MKTTTAETARRLLIAVAAVAITTFIRYCLSPALGFESPYLIYPLAVMIAGWYGGLVPGLVATVVGAVVGNVFFLSPDWSLSLSTPGAVMGFVIMLANGVVISALCETLHKDWRQLAARSAEARQSAAIIASSNDAVIVKDLQGRIQRWNPAAERMYGYTAAEVVGRSIDVIVPAEQRAEIPMLLERVSRGERVQSMETLRRHKDGRILHISLSVSPVNDAAGRVAAASDIERDVTERKQSEEALRASEERWRTLVENAPEQILSLDRAGRVLFLNNRPVADYAPEELQGRSLLDLISPERREAAARALAVVFEEQRAVSEELPILGRDGALRWYDTRFGPLRRDDVIEAVVIATDVTAQREAEHERERLLREAQTARADAEQGRLRSEFLARATAALAASLDYETTLPALARLTVPEFADACVVHLVAEDGSLQRLAAVYASPAREAVAQEIQRLRPLGIELPVRASSLLRDGRAIWAEEVSDDGLRVAAEDPRHLELLRRLGVRSYILMPLVARGQTFGTIGFMSLDSGRHYSERDLRTADEISRRAAVAIDHAHVYRQAQEANRLKDEFLATLSHELRTPLNAIVGWAHLLRSGELDPTASQRAIETIERNAKAQTQLISDILDVSRIISGKLRLEVRPVDVPPVIEAALDSVRPAADAKGISVDAFVEPTIGPVSGDPDRLQQVVWNLLSNAIKFTPRGGRVQVRLHRRGGQIEVLVSDTGAGISTEFLPHVFERFRQADASSTRRHGGLGIGLSIVKHLVELHGGTVQATSEGPGRGATFGVRLPALGAEAPDLEHDRRRRSGEAEGASATLPSLEGVRVLAVDDEDSARDLIAAILTRRGAQVRTVASATEAIAAFESFAPDVVVSDIEMPGENGYSLIRRIRALPPERGGNTPAAALTAYARMEDRMRVLVSGFQLHISKPVDPSELVAVVASLTGRLTERASV
jgi:PAS domain S-box-containing protein